MSTDRVPIARVRRTMLLLWGGTSVFVMCLMLVQTANGKYGTKSGEAWSWAMAAVLPTLTVLIGNVARIARATEEDERRVSRLAYLGAIATSGFYLLTFISTFLLVPFVGGSAIEWYTSAKQWLAPTQGLALLFISDFFAVAAETREAETT